MHNILTTLYNVIFSSPFFAICLCIFAYKIGQIIQQKTKTVIANPLLIATTLIICFLIITRTPYAKFKTGADILLLFLGPATEVLALSIYNQREVLIKNIVPVLAGTIAGAATSVASVYLLCRLFGLDETITKSMMPKSVTTPIALSLSKDIGGIAGLTMCSIIITGMTGAIAAPYLIKLFRVKSKVAAGVAIGTCSHAIGTATALEMGEVYGAMSSVAIGIAGIATTIIFIFL